MKTSSHVIAGFVLMLGLGVVSVEAQSGFEERRGSTESPFLPLTQIFLRPGNSIDSTRLVFYAEISQSLLRFVSDGDRYTAGYEMTVSVKNAKGELANEKIIRRRVTADSIRSADPPRITETVTMNIVPGEYKLFLEFLDLETREPRQRQDKIVVPDFFSKPLNATEIQFFKQPGDSAFPVLAPVRTMADSQFYALFYLAVKNSPKTVRICRWVKNSAGETSFADSASVTLKTPVTPLILPLSQSFAFGKYTMDVLVFDGRDSIRLGKPFFIRWKSHPQTLTQFDQVIEVLAELVHPPELDGYEKMTSEDQKTAFEAFWKKRDPTPNTEENELESEFYRRVTAANQNFSQYQQSLKGWQTDRGRIYIVNGQPDEIERPTMPAMSSKSYEIWYYRSLNRRFVFEDRIGDGNFRLVGQE